MQNHDVDGIQVDGEELVVRGKTLGRGLPRWLHSLQNPARSRAYLAKEPQQGGFQGHGPFALASIGLAGSPREMGLEAGAFLQVRADPHLPKAQLEVAPAQQQHGQA